MGSSPESTPGADIELFPDEVDLSRLQIAGGGWDGSALPFPLVMESDNMGGEGAWVLRLMQAVWAFSSIPGSVFAEIVAHGRLRICYDQKSGIMFGRGLWDSSREPTLAKEIRRGGHLLRLLGLELDSFWQKSHRHMRHWVVQGNQGVDMLVQMGRAAGFHFMGPGELMIRENFQEDKKVPSPLVFRWQLPSDQDRRLSSEFMVEELFRDEEEEIRGITGRLQRALGWRGDDQRTMDVQVAADLQSLGRTVPRGLLSGDRSLLQVQEKLKHLLRASAFQEGTPWRKLEARVSGRWPGEGIRAWELRLSFGKMRRMLPRVKYTK